MIFCSAFQGLSQLVQYRYEGMRGLTDARDRRLIPSESRNATLEGFTERVFDAVKILLSLCQIAREVHHIFRIV